MLPARAFLHCFLPGLVNISSWFLVINIILLMWACSFVDLHCIVVHAFEHVLGERDSFILDHVIELFPRLNNIQMITWLNINAYTPHLDSPLIILWCGPFCFILACLHIILFLNPMNGIPNETSALVHEPSFEDSFIGSLKILGLQMFPFFWWWMCSKILNHDQFLFHHGWGLILGMLLLHECLELYLPCSYILEDISTHAFFFLSKMLHLHEYLEYVHHATRF